MKHSTGNFISRLGDRQLPHYGQIVLLALLLMAALETRHITNEFSRDQRAQAYRGQEIRLATVMAFLPAPVRHSERTIAVFAYAFYVSAALWALQLGIPWTPWGATVAFTGVMAVHFENMNWLTHATHAENMLLILYAMWYTAYGREIREALRAGRFWTTPLYPRWVFTAGVAYLCIFYTNAGLNKLIVSGPSWANGTPLQLWAAAMGNARSIAGSLIVSHRAVAAGLQIVTLVAETSAVFAIVFPRLRVLFGLALIAFHLGSMRLFGYRFEANAVILALLLFPLDRWITQSAVHKCERTRSGRSIPLDAGPFERALRARFDVFGGRGEAETESPDRMGVA
jgi:hypothetical protein